MLPPKLQRELEELRAQYELEVHDDGSFVHVVLRALPIAHGYSQTSTNVLIRIPRAYPDAGPDMFWTDEGLLLADGRIPQSAECLEDHIGRRWRRFSWHHNRWNPIVDNVHNYIEFVKDRLRQTK
jgi:hypothetical protein